MASASGLESMLALAAVSALVSACVSAPRLILVSEPVVVAALAKTCA